MTDLNWCIELTDGRTFSGVEEVEEGAVRIRCALPGARRSTRSSEVLFKTSTRRLLRAMRRSSRRLSPVVA